jgi:hypothetical protein
MFIGKTHIKIREKPSHIQPNCEKKPPNKTFILRARGTYLGGGLRNF